MKKARARSGGGGCHVVPLLPPLRLLLHAPRLQRRQFHANAGDARAEEPWSLTSLQEKLIKIGARVMSHCVTANTDANWD
jgi:hypothetical protein